MLKNNYGARWKSAPNKLQNPIHAPTPEESPLTYCRDILTKTSMVAIDGETVTCKDCLRKLRRYPQYANYLKVHYNIHTTAVWTE